MSNKHKPNHLIGEKSPYLIQHLYNPVDWYPWGVEAFSKARSEDKPVFLSIGYLACHWCHVMAHESFEDEKVADILNRKYISIKVDREERPDIDSIYMKVCQMLTGQGGWPLSVFLTPEQKPFYAGTYFPKESRYGRPGFIELLNEISDIYSEKSEKVADVVDKIYSTLTKQGEQINETGLKPDIIHETFRQIERSFDEKYGGFGIAPKFPTPHSLTFLLRYFFWHKEDFSLDMVEKTLNGMADGGIYDHIGFGFSRYSTDDKWLVPHFEKMLCDNALLLTAYTEAFQLTKEERYRKVCDQTVSFIEREMTHPKGGFYSAIDADSEGIEGKYYVWDQQEIYDILGDKLGDTYCKTYNISKTGNFEGKNIPNLIGTNKHTLEELSLDLEKARQLLFEKRKARVFPHVDDKILTSWNSLMIVALSKVSRITSKDKCLDLAINALRFIENNLIIDKRIMIRYRDEEVKIKGYIDDYAFLAWAYLELYESTFDLTYLKKARHVIDEMISLFWDEENGGFYFSGNDAENLIIKEKEIYDGALPSGNSVAAFTMAKLANIVGDTDLLKKVDIMFNTFKNSVESYPSGHTFFLQSLILQNMPKKEIVILGSQDDRARKEILEAISETFLPDLSILVAEHADEFRTVADFASNYKTLNAKTTVYICENYSCKQPLTDIDEIFKELNLNQTRNYVV